MSSASALYAAVLLNLSVTVLSLIGTVISFKRDGAGMFLYYTVDSNIFAEISCAVYAFFLIRRLSVKKKIPVWAVMAKYAAVCCLSVTFLVVVTVLAPMHGANGYRMMLFSGDMFFHHLVSPVLAAVSFFLFDRVPFRASRAALFALIPTAVYAAAAVVLNIAGIIEGPYPFLHVYEQPFFMSVLWFVLILGGAYAAALLIAFLRRRP